MNFDHVDIPIPEGGIIKLSPSSLANFFESPSIWYRENFLGEEGFQGNTASTLGTIVHAVAEAVGSGESATKEEILKYLDSNTNPDVDVEEIKTHFESMSGALVNEYLLNNLPDLIENQIIAEVKGGVYVGGTYDAILGSTLRDYKTASKKPNTDTIPFKYELQLMTYCWVLRKLRGEALLLPEGEEKDSLLKLYPVINRIQLVYVVKATKTLPVRVFVVNKMLTVESWDLVEKTLDLIATTITTQIEQPELVPLLYKSMKLKGL